MSERTFDVGAAQLGAETSEPVAFVMMDFVGEPQFVHSSVGIITWGREDWYGLGQLGSMEPVQERLGYAPSRIKLVLTQVAGQYLSDSINESTWGRLCEIWLGNWSGASLIRDPYLLIRGRMGPVEAKIGGSDAALAVTVEDIRGVLDRVNGLRSTMQDHQLESSGDTFYRWLPKMQDHRYVFNGGNFGGNNVSNPSGPTPPVVPPWYPWRP